MSCCMKNWWPIVVLASFLINGFYGIRWTEEGNLNDTFNTYDVLKTAEKFVELSENARYIRLYRSDSFDFQTTSNSSLKIVEFKNNIKKFLTCPATDYSTNKIVQNSIIQNQEFQRCLSSHCQIKSTSPKCNDPTISFELQNVVDQNCLSKIQKVHIGNTQTEFSLMASNFFYYADSLEEIELDSTTIKFADKFDDLFVNLPNLRILRMNNFAYTAIGNIIRDNPQLILVESLSTRAWNLCDRIEIIDKTTAKRTYMDLEKKGVKFLSKDAEELLKSTLDVSKKVLDENLEYSKSVSEKINSFWNTLPSTEQNVLIFGAVFIAFSLFFCGRRCAN